MAPKIHYSNRAIVEAAIQVVRQSGPGAISARNVAHEMGGSTQPIYRAFSSIDALVHEAIRMAAEIAFSYARDAHDRESSFLAIGLGYLEFSRAEPNLFRLLLTSGRASWSPASPTWPLHGLTQKMREDGFLRELPEETLRTLLRDMFIYTHGLSALAPAQPSESDRESERELLRSVGGRMMAMVALEASGQLSLDEMKERFHP